MGKIILRLDRVMADRKMSLKELLMSLENLPASARTSVRNNGGGVHNHELYFDAMKGPVGQEPVGALAEAVKRDFGSYQQFKEQMKQAAVTQFGSGWAWLLTDAEGKLSIQQTANQDVPDLSLQIGFPFDFSQVVQAGYLCYQPVEYQYCTRNGGQDVETGPGHPGRYVDEADCCCDCQSCYSHACQFFQAGFSACVQYSFYFFPV